VKSPVCLGQDYLFSKSNSRYKEVLLRSSANHGAAS
jgi:hypothetical protein